MRGPLKDPKAANLLYENIYDCLGRFRPVTEMARVLFISADLPAIGPIFPPLHLQVGPQNDLKADMTIKQGVTLDRFVRVKSESFNMMVVVSAGRMPKAAIFSVHHGQQAEPYAVLGEVR
jgi:hypothetical protein